MAKITKGQQSPASGKAKGNKLDFLMDSEESQEEFEQVKSEAEIKAQMAGQGQRFWLNNEEEAEITFLDGDVDDDGLLKFKSFYEHQLKIGNSWNNFFVCLRSIKEPCPICQYGNTSYFVGLFTIIDHRTIESTKHEGKVYKDEIKLFPAKTKTLQTLQAMAKKYGPLAGCSYTVLRTDKKEPKVGNQFMYSEKSTLDSLAKKYGTANKVVQPIKYNEVLKFRDADELAKMGFKMTTVGNEAAPNDDVAF